MFKLLILLTVAALSSASDYDKLAGEWTIVAATSTGKPSNACNKFVIEVSESKCNCQGKEVPLAQLKILKPGSEFIKFVPFLVSSETEVDAALQKKAEDCSCGEVMENKHVLKVLNDNYAIVYAPSGDNSHAGALLRKAVTSKSDFDDFLKNVEDLKDKNYTPLCNEFSS